jgi:GxxExxY protein
MSGLDSERDTLTSEIIGGAIEVHKALGPGLLESTYEECLAFELAERGFDVRRQVPLPVVYMGVKLDAGYRLDMTVNGTVILELKCVDNVHPIHEAQLLTYLKLARYRVGLIINFHTAVLKNGIVRKVL